MNSVVSHDAWSPGVQVNNSLTGEVGTSVDAIALRWICANGMVDVWNTSGRWNRRTGDQDEIYDWARAAVDEILGGYDELFPLVDSLNHIHLQDQTASTIAALFDRYGIPRAVRAEITDNLVNSTDNSVYGVMNAITQAANNPELSPNVVGMVMATGGRLAREFGNSKLVFESVTAGENLDLSGRQSINIEGRDIAVSYTHLTLPTIYSV